MKRTTQKHLCAKDWYSLDLVQTGPGSITQALIGLVKDSIPPAEIKNIEVHTPEELHCTMYFQHQNGQDREYHEKFFKESSCKVTITDDHWLYWDQKGNCACAVSLWKAEAKLFWGSLTPHISCSKTLKMQWRDLGKFVSKIERSNWVAGGERESVIRTQIKCVQYPPELGNTSGKSGSPQWRNQPRLYHCLIQSNWQRRVRPKQCTSKVVVQRISWCRTY